MKLNAKMLALMAALAAGVASAQDPIVANPNGYTADTETITNVANATFTDPTNPADTDPNNPKGGSTSNTVTTKVLPLPSFDIVYQSGYTDGQTNTNANTAAGVSGDATAPLQDNVKNVTPGTTQTDTYYLVNNGNTPLNVTVTAATTGVTNVTYTYEDSATGATITPDAATGTIPLAFGQIIKITQKTLVPTDATGVVGASPAGSATIANNPNAGIPTSATDSTLYENQTVVPASGTTAASVTGPANGTDLQYQALNIYTTTLKNNPNTPDGTTDVPGTPSVTPPGTDPTNPPKGYDGGSTSTVTPPPGGGTTPGTTPIVSSLTGDKQEAYPPADGNATPDTVVFTNTITNSGTLTDHVILAPGKDVPTKLDPTTNTYVPDLTAGTTVTDTNDVVWTYVSPGTWTSPSPADPTKTVTVQFLDGAGNPTNTVTVDPATGTTPSVTPYTTQVTYPDSNTTNLPKDIVVVIEATSGNNPNIKADPTTDIIHPPAMTFGDTKKVTQAPDVVEDPSTGYYPGSSTATSTTAPGATASYPMSISNSGTYPDSTDLAGAVAIKLTDGTTKVYPVSYTGATIDPAYTGNLTDPLGITPLPGTSPVVVNSTTYYAPTYTTPVIAAHGTLDVTANVVVPSNALATTGTDTTSANPEPKLQQTATGVFSTIQQTDLNDPLAIAPKGSVVVGKFTKTTDGAPAAGTQYAVNGASNTASVSTTAPAAGVINVTNPAGYNGLAGVQANTQYAPGVPYNYQIIAKNGYNAPISNFALSDDLDSNLTYVSSTCDVFDKTGTSIYVAPATAPAGTLSGTKVSCAPVTLPEGFTANLTINVTIK